MTMKKDEAKVDNASGGAEQPAGPKPGKGKGKNKGECKGLEPSGKVWQHALGGWSPGLVSRLMGRGT